MFEHLRGVLAAAATPMRADLSPATEDLPRLLDHLAGLGNHGALLLGTTGEGPSLSVAERAEVFAAAARWRMARGETGFLLVGGTGCAALTDTVAATRAAYAAGLDAALVLPPFYYGGVSAPGVTEALRTVLREAVPLGRPCLLYHIPRVSGVPVAFETIDALRTEFPDRLAGLKDSGADLAHTERLCRTYPDLAILTGTDSQLAASLAAGAAGGITALANVCGDLARAVYDAHAAGADGAPAQDRLTAARSALERVPAVPAIKALLADLHGLPEWPVRPPLEPLPATERQALRAAVERARG